MKRTHPTLAAISLLAVSPCALRADTAPPALLPQPVKTELRTGTFRLDANTPVLAAAELKAEAVLLAADLHLTNAAPPPDGAPAAAIRLTLDPKLAHLAPEGYRLKVGRSSIDLTAPAAAGIFHGGRTLLQLLPAAGLGSGAEIPCIDIEDHPRFAWRGLMMDCSRTFQSLEYLRATVDRMAAYKLNTLHLHLTDDQGWRMEIKAYPELTRKGAIFPEKFGEPARHQGFYTQAQMREFIAYAAARHVTIVPEIEMPGHSLAALSCYPELSCSGGPFEIYPWTKGAGITEDVFCAGNDATFEFFDKVLGEVAAVFPGTYLHVGGDEVPKKAWKACAKCQARMKAEGLKNEAELQSYFIRRAEKLVAKHGKRLIGWDEILEGGLAPDATVMSWRGVSGGIAAASAGHDVVMSPYTHLYFDFVCKKTDSARVFSFDPVAGIPPDAVRHVLGIQANFWSHLDREPDLVDVQLFPRVLALAERAWSPDNRGDWPDYQRRALAHLPVLQRMGIHYQTADLPAAAVPSH